jgi:uncharacterized membrane protein YozB (DUF420 family)
VFSPAFNVLLNQLCAIALCVGFYFIKNRNREAHRMSAAPVSVPDFFLFMYWLVALQLRQPILRIAVLRVQL